MGKRIPISSTTETQVLMISARRCALCCGFDGDLSRKKGQIAHIDQDPTIADENDLVYLCLEHHDEYDSQTSQVKGISPAELRSYKARLIAAVAAGEHLNSHVPSADAAKMSAVRGHDERVFRQANDLMPERRLLDLLNRLQSDDSYFMSEVRRLDDFRYFFSETGNQFIDQDLSRKLNALLESLDAVLTFLARHFFIFPEHQDGRDNLRLCMYPDLNVDRMGSGTAEEMQRYANFQAQLDKETSVLRAAYQEYRLAVKTYLHL